MKKIIYISVLAMFSFAFNACNDTNKDSEASNTPLSTELSKAQGGKYFGGVLKVNSINKYTSLFPAEISDVYSQHIASQVFEGLFKYNQSTLEIEPCVAETHEIDASKKIYTFNLRKGVTFHDDDCFENGKGREVTAEDFKNSLEFLCSNNSMNKSKYVIAGFIKGSKAFENGKTKEVSGIKVLDKYTLQIELNEPFSGFEHILALTQTAVYPKEAMDKYGDDIKNHPIGCGPYFLKSNGEKIVLEKNSSYWKKDEFGNQLPFISQIEISFEGNKSKELANFNKGELDFVWGVPVEDISSILGTLDEALEGKNREFNLQSVNSLQIQYFGFNLTHEALKNKKVRLAFNYAINKDSIIDYILQGEGEASKHGIIPKMHGYDNSVIKGFDFDLPKAKKLLAEAGYPNGKNLPQIEMPYSEAGQVNQLLIESIQQQLLANLGVNVKLVKSNSQAINKDREEGKLDMWRYGWIADYPDPSNFIAQFHSKHIQEENPFSINFSRYENKEFDQFLDKAMTETDEVKRMKYYAKAEQILVDDAVFMPIYYASEIRLVNPLLKNFKINEIELRDYSVTYFVNEKAKKNVRIYDNLEQ